MRSESWQALGTGNILAHVRKDLKAASKEVVIVGPWIDAFFAEAVLMGLHQKVNLRVITRPAEKSNDGFVEHAMAARATFMGRQKTEVKLLGSLHAKVITVDERIAYCGSANWYRYSLERSREIVLRGPITKSSDILDEVQTLWDQSKENDDDSVLPAIPSRKIFQGYCDEILDPVAVAKLKEVPGSFVLHQPRRKR